MELLKLCCLQGYESIYFGQNNLLICGAFIPSNGQDRLPN